MDRAVLARVDQGMTHASVQPHLFVDRFSRLGKTLFVFAFSVVKHSTHDAVMHIEDLIGDSRLGIEQYCNERGVASSALQLSQMLSSHLRTFVRELSKTPLMDGLAKLRGEFYLANSMQPIEMREHIFGLGFSGRLPKPGDYYRTLTRQEPGIKFSTAVRPGRDFQSAQSFAP
jgi:hypothetical protein